MNEQIRKFAFESADGLLRFDERGFMLYEDEVEKFAELVRADEREVCAAVADIALLGCERSIRDRVVQAIRARGETK